jgi:hypothetical protein
MNSDEGYNDEQYKYDTITLLTSLLIAQGRTYDVLLTILGIQDSGKAEFLRNMHEEGKMWFPPPALGPDET